MPPQCVVIDGLQFPEEAQCAAQQHHCLVAHLFHTNFNLSPFTADLKAEQQCPPLRACKFYREQRGGITVQHSCFKQTV